MKRETVKPEKKLTWSAGSPTPRERIAGVH
jgi:hypothetical protein